MFVKHSIKRVGGNPREEAMLEGPMKLCATVLACAFQNPTLNSGTPILPEPAKTGVVIALSYSPAFLRCFSIETAARPENPYPVPVSVCTEGTSFWMITPIEVNVGNMTSDCLMRFYGSTASLARGKISTGITCPNQLSQEGAEQAPPQQFMPLFWASFVRLDEVWRAGH